MSRGDSKELDSFTGSKVRFVAEQLGIPENDLKEEIVRKFKDHSRVSRAYLAQVDYDEAKYFDVALCIFLEHSEGEKLANDIASSFRRMFGPHEHLDILFLSDSQETELRKVCCPFFTSRDHRFGHPDFYLTSSEGYNLEQIRACYKRQRLLGDHPDGYMLCEIAPPILGQSYGLGKQDIHEIIIASRHAGYSIFSIKEWPVYVHVARLTSDAVSDKFIIAKDDIESIGWAEIHESSASAKALR
ncbi:MAG: enhanced serine sensitivity protein SseB C-terminal domain-containing protein [Gammaproteobacteria bacterium]